MSALQLTKHPVSVSPSEPGWYVVWESFGASPQIAWWQSVQRGWRHGASVLSVRYWAGPVPARGDA